MSLTIEEAIAVVRKLGLQAPSTEILLRLVDYERRKFTRSDQGFLRELVNELIRRGEYPAEWNGEPLDPDPFKRMEGWGAYWHIYTEPLNCPFCKADLRNLEWGPPGKREIGHYSNALDTTVGYECPDCHQWWDR